MLAIHVDHGSNHVALAVGVDEGEQLVHVAIGVPQREYSVTVALAHSFHLARLECGVLPINVLQDIGVQQGVVEGRVEHRSLVFCSAFNLYARQVFVPSVACLFLYLVEIFALLFDIEVFAGVGHANKRHAHAYHNGFVGMAVEVEIQANVVASDLFRVVGV